MSIDMIDDMSRKKKIGSTIHAFAAKLWIKKGDGYSLRGKRA